MVVGVFASLVTAQYAVADLLASGYSQHDIRLVVRGRAEGQAADANCHLPSSRPYGTEPSCNRDEAVDAALGPGEDSESALTAMLESAGLQPSAARFFADAICNGAVLVAVHCAAPRAWDARDILDVYNDTSGGRHVPGALH